MVGWQAGRGRQRELSEAMDNVGSSLQFALASTVDAYARFI
jgi:hypothetical protein